MKRSNFSEEQVASALRQVEGGTPGGDVCRQLGVSEATFYAWKKKYAHLGVSELRRLRQLEGENARLKRLFADLTLDKHMLSEALRRDTKARALMRDPLPSAVTTLRPKAEALLRPFGPTGRRPRHAARSGLRARERSPESAAPRDRCGECGPAC